MLTPDHRYQGATPYKNFPDLGSSLLRDFKANGDYNFIAKSAKKIQCVFLNPGHFPSAPMLNTSHSSSNFLRPISSFWPRNFAFLAQTIFLCHLSTAWKEKSWKIRNIMQCIMQCSKKWLWKCMNTPLQRGSYFDLLYCVFFGWRQLFTTCGDSF